MSAGRDDAGWSWWPAPAKLNLFLHITGRRADGYHELQTVFRLLDWGDRIGLRLREDGQGRARPAWPRPMTWRCAPRAAQRGEGRARCDIIVEKHVPAGGGFGGGSSDAATVLVVLNRLWAPAWTRTPGRAGPAPGRRRAGVRARPQRLGRRVGERLQPITLAGLVCGGRTGCSCAHAGLFADPDLTRDSPVAKIEDFASGTLVGNAFEPVLRRREPAVEAALAALSDIGTARLTGSGSGCFVEFASQAAEQGRSKLPKELRARVAAGVARSPLLDALEQH
jgi:4-diphosphocytidyl-2-C-methyl-D-erythritol kinase